MRYVKGFAGGAVPAIAVCFCYLLILAIEAGNIIETPINLDPLVLVLTVMKIMLFGFRA
jgi:hypothetical protein